MKFKKLTLNKLDVSKYDKEMKMRIIISAIIFTITLTFIGLIVYFLFYANFTKTKLLSYGNCSVKYEYSYNDFENDESNKKTGGHGKSNEIEYEIAQHRLMKCLCDEYLITKDTILKNYIIKYVTNDYLVKEYYIEEVIALDPNIENLCKFKDKIFVYDSVSLNLCKQYEITNEKSLLQQILQHYRNNKFARETYCYLMKITTVNPDIDSICKYKELVFGPIIIQ